MVFTLKVSETAQSVVVNRHTIAVQGEGGTLFGLTARLYGAITLKYARVQCDIRRNGKRIVADLL